MKQYKWKIILILSVLVISAIYLVPTVLDREIEWWPSGKLNLGLDLKGGMHIIYGVRTDKAVHSEMVRIKRELANWLEEEKALFSEAKVNDANELELTFADHETMGRARKWVEKELNSYDTFSNGSLSFGIRMRPGLISDVEQTALDQAREKIMRRVDQFGVREPSITTQGTDRIVVRLPGIVDPEQAKKLLGTTAVLHFKIVHQGGFAPTEEALLNKYSGNPPAGYKIYPAHGEKTGSQSGFYMLPIEPNMTGQNLIDARPSFDEHGANSVSFQFNAKGAKDFGELSGANIDKQLAIVLDDIVWSAPVLRSKITSRGEITGTFTRDDTRNLSIVLRSGSLPVPVEIEEERTVGPLLGKDSIEKGTVSFIVGGILVLLFMAIYYKMAGIIANFALVLNILIILGGLALFDATLTFPGIAGIILTIGMAVDANVIIFERIREELRIGKTPRAAIDTGYSKALWTILDANITTGGAAIILFQFGTGPIKGFAVTLTIGIIASVFTAVVVTRLIFDLWAGRATVTKLSI